MICCGFCEKKKGLENGAKKEKTEKCEKQIEVFRQFQRPMGAWDFAGTIGNGYIFVHAKYGVNP